MMETRGWTMKTKILWERVDAKKDGQGEHLQVLSALVFSFIYLFISGLRFQHKNNQVALACTKVCLDSSCTYVCMFNTQYCC